MIASKTLSLAALVIFAVTTTANGQDAINWRNVWPMHTIPSFFEEYPVLQRLYERHEPLTSFLEGNTTARNQFPHQVGLVLNRTNQFGFCGGSLISNQWILTTSHCLFGATDGTAILGGHRLRDATEGGQLRIAVNHFVVHPGWNGLRLSDDVGLIRLPAIVSFNGEIRGHDVR